ncbi:MAG: nucleotidyltransferase domain-containing protein [Chloroflexi bacterium]|nr:nucleotidyltransferase domain-containing protein [Chloroflexota bacterium]
MGRRTFAPELARLARLLQQAPVRIERAILFGSRARGDYMEHSDWDLVTVSPDFQGMSFSARASLLLGAIPLHPAEYFCYTPQEFEQGREDIGVLRQALQEGVEVPLGE